MLQTTFIKYVENACINLIYLVRKYNAFWQLDMKSQYLKKKSKSMQH